MPLNLQVKIPMIGYGFGSTSSETNWSKADLFLDDGDYDGATYYFEVNAWNDQGQDFDMFLLGGDDTVLATITIPANTGTSISHKRFRSSAFTPQSGLIRYRPRIEATNGSNDVGTMGCFIIIDQVDATKTRTPIMGSFRAGGTSQNQNGYIDAVGSVFGEYSDIPNTNGFIKDDSWYEGGTLTWEMDVTARSNTGAGGDVELYNRDGDAQIGTLNFTTGAIENKILDITASLNWGAVTDILNWRHRKITSGSMFTYRCLLFAKITGGMTKARCYHVCAFSNVWATSEDHQRRDLYELSKFSDGTTVKLALGGFMHFADGDIMMKVRSYGTNDGPGSTGGADVDDTEVGLSPFFTIEYGESSSNIASLLTEGDRYGGVTRRTDTSRYNAMVFMVFDVEQATHKERAVSDQMVLTDAVATLRSEQLQLEVSEGAWPAYAEDVLLFAAAHLTREVADDINAATWADAVAVDLAVHQSSGVGDAMSMDDAIAVQLSVHLEINVSDDMNNWQDEASVPERSLFVGLSPNVLVLFTMELEGGNDYTSSIPVRGADRYFEGRVVNFGPIDRSIPVPSGIPRIGDGFVELADTDQKYRKLFAANPPQGRAIDLVMMPPDEPLSMAARIYRGEITHVDFPEGSAIINFADISFGFLDEDIPALGTPDNFPSLPDPTVEVFVPIPIGFIRATTTEGAYAAPLVDTINNLYIISRYPIEQVTVVYRKSGDDPFFTAVLPTEFNVVTEARFIDPNDYVFVYIQFASAQPDGTEIRVDVKGWVPQDDVGLGSTTAQTDPALVIKAFLKEISRRTNDQLDLPSFDTTEALTTSRGYLAAGVFERGINQRSALAQLVSSFQIDLFQNKDAKIAIDLADVAVPTRPVFDDILRLVRGSVHNALPNPYYNRFRYRYSLDHSTGEWGAEDQFDNEIERGVTGSLVEAPLVDMYFVRDGATAIQVISDIAAYFSLGSFQFKSALPGPQVVEDLELAKNIGITHYGGISAGGLGYTNVEFRTHKLLFDPNLLKYEVSAIRRVQPPAEAFGVIGEDVFWSANLIPGPYMAINGVFYGAFLNASDRSKVQIQQSQDWGLHWEKIDEANAPNLTDDIASHDTYWDEGNDLVMEIATQENVTGRVAYHRFNMGTGRWVLVDEEVFVPPTNPVGQHFVSIIKTRQSKKLVIFFRASDTVGDTDPHLERQQLTIKPVGGAWSTPIFIGDEESGGNPNPRNFRGNRVVAGKEDLIHCFYMVRGSLSEGWHTERIEDWHTTIDNNEVKGDDLIRFIGNIVYYHSSLPYGIPAAKQDADGEVLIDLPVQGFVGRTSSFPYTSDVILEFPPDPNLNVVSQPEQISELNAFQGEATSKGSTRYSHITMMKNFTNNVRYVIFPGVNESVVQKRIAGDLPRFSPWDPPFGDGFSNKAGPTWNAVSGAFFMSKMAARLYTINGIDYIAFFMQGGMDNDDRDIIRDKGAWTGSGVSATFFRWFRVNDLPDDPSFTRRVFIQSIADAF
jgi:hypothetical protein